MSNHESCVIHVLTYQRVPSAKERSKECAECGKATDKNSACGGCRANPMCQDVYYCGKECQRWMKAYKWICIINSYKY